MHLIYITCPDADTADRLARLAVAERLAACANILPGMRSVYRWEGQIEQADELVLLLKTTKDSAPALMARMGDQHPYDQPAILDIAAGGDAGFLNWIAGEVSA